MRRLAWKLRALEHRGFRIQVADDGALVVGPKSSLTNDDAAICSNRAELIPLVTSVEITKKQAESKLTELLRQADGREFVEKTRLTGGGMAS